MSKFRRQLMAASISEPVPPLPYDAEVEYIEVNGVQAINTGIYPTSLDLVIEYESYNHAKWGWTYQGSDSNTWIASGGNRVYWKNWSSSYRYDISNNNDNAWHTWKYDMQNGFWKDGTKLVSFTASLGNTQISTTPLYFGQYYESNTSQVSVNTDDFVPTLIKWLKVSRGGVLLRHYIPVRVGQVGYFYDKVSGELFGNVGVGNFTSSGISATPYDAKVEWLRFDGRQNINTGIYPIPLNLVLVYKSYNHAKWGWTYQGDANKTWIASGGNRVYWKNWNTSYRYDISDWNANTWHTWKYDMQNGFWKDGTKVATFTASIATTAISSVPLYFGNYYELNASAMNTTQYSDNLYMNVESLKVSGGSTLVRDYIPVRCGQVGYFYDKVSGMFFKNNGNGAFIYGNDITT